MTTNLVCPYCGSDTLSVTEESGYGCSVCGYHKNCFSDHIAQVLSELGMKYNQDDCKLDFNYGKLHADQSYLLSLNNKKRTITINILKRSTEDDLLLNIISLLRKHDILEHCKIIIHEADITPKMECPLCHDRFNISIIERRAVCSCGAYSISTTDALTSILSLHNELISHGHHDSTYFFCLYGESKPAIQVSISLKNEDLIIIVRETAQSDNDNHQLVIAVLITLSWYFKAEIMIGQK